MKNKEKFEFPWPYLIIGLLLWFLLYIFFDIPNRFAYQNKGWDIPTDPREKAAYDHAHSIQLPKKVPDGGFVYYKVNESFDPAKAAGTKSNPALIKTIIKDFPEPKPFNFAWARFKSLFGVDKSVREQYFNHLCDTEAGEYVYETVTKDVKGILQMRPMPERTEALMFDRYGFEDPAKWHTLDSDSAPSQFITSSGKFVLQSVVSDFSKFDFFESPHSPYEMPYPKSKDKKKWQFSKVTDGKKYYWHYTDFELLPRKPYQTKPMYGKRVKPIKRPSAIYAYTWRGIKRNHDRRYGIAGGELIVLNRNTNEILGFRRTFAIGRPVKGKVLSLGWEYSIACPSRTAFGGLPMNPVTYKGDYSYYFVVKIFKNLFKSYSKYYFQYLQQQGEL